MRSIHDAVGDALAQIGPGLYGVACSGGADSMALADATIEVAGAQHVVVLVIDHGLSHGSEAVAETVAQWARARGAAGVVRRVQVERRASLEAAAREVRYEALEQLADELGLAAILVGHTARDQAETVLMRILRGTGPAGLAGIPARRDRIVRPLLAIDRATIDDYVVRRGLPVWDDPMNVDPTLTRVRIRRELLPLLRRENPQLDAALVRLADNAAEWLAVIDALAAPFGQFPIDCAALATRPRAIRKRALALALEALDLGWESAHLEAIDDLICRETAGEVTIDVAGVRLVRTYEWLGLDTLPQDPSEIEPPMGCEVRAWRAGDRMRPARLKGRSRKLSDLFADAKVPKSIRAAARVIVRSVDSVILWAEHVGIAHASVLLDGEREKLAAMPTRTVGSF